MNSREQAAAYLSAGLVVLPIPLRSKSPGFDGWNVRTIEQAVASFDRDFPIYEEKNIGILLGKPSGGIVDVDIDCPEAVPFTDLLLPRTTTFDRPSKPRSHKEVICDISTAQFKDPLTKKMLIEIRSTGVQTVYPGSVHESGELIKFADTCAPIEIHAEELRRRISWAAAGALLTRYWPRDGRHDVQLALAGILLGGGWKPEDALEFLCTVCRFAGDEDRTKREATIRSTLNKLSTGEHVTGWGVLAKAFNPVVFNTARTWLKTEITKKRPVRRERLEKIARRWKKNHSDSKQTLGEVLELVCKGESFALPDEREDIIFQLAREISKELPDAEPRSLADLFAPSLSLMILESADGCPTVEDVQKKFSSALEASSTNGWHNRLTLSDNGLPKTCLGNTVTILANHESWRNVLAYDERSLRPMFMKQPPWDEDYDGTETEIPRGIQDPDGTRCATWMNRHQRLTINGEMSLKAMTAIGQKQGFDRLKEELEALPPWDGTPRLDTWLVTYGGVEDKSYVRLVGSKWVIGGMARTFEPGCKMDSTLILEGKQGQGKSTLLKTLAGPKHFTDQLPDLNDKDAKQQIHGPWIIELNELDAIERKEFSTVKGFLTICTDRFRPPYGAGVEEFNRRCVFAGTTNKETYLRDETGARRFWPVKVKKRCNITGLVKDRDQVLAEALHRYRAKEPWWLSEQEEIIARIEQAERQEEDPWISPIVHALVEGVLKDPGSQTRTAEAYHIRPRAKEVTVVMILQHVLGMALNTWSRAHQMRVASILTVLNWSRHNVRRNGKPIWVYFSPEENNPDASNPPLVALPTVFPRLVAP